MWRLDYPWLLLAVVLAWPAYRWLPAYVQRRDAVRIPFFEATARISGQTPRERGVRRGGVQLAVNVAVWVLTVVALARPVFVEPPLQRNVPVRDILLAIDISQSMQAQDFRRPDGEPVDRLQAVQAVVSDFIDRRKDDRLGLIVFGSAAYPQAPLTQDHASLHALLAQAAVGMAGPNTAIGDAIGLAIRQFDRATEPDKVLILLSDGNDTASAVPPDQAAAMARQRHIVVHTIGIGDPAAQGEDKVDFDALRRIAQATGGQFFEARDRQALESVYATLDRITPHQVRQYTQQPTRDYFWIPLGAALLLLAVIHAWGALAGGALARSAARPRETPWTST